MIQTGGGRAPSEGGGPKAEAGAGAILMITTTHGNTQY